jgi:Peptidase C13 family
MANLLGTSPVRRKVLVVSACYAGVYKALANADTLVITAADADHPSFGCQEGAKWTYFGDAFFNQALRQAAATNEPLDQVFAEAAKLVRARELKEGFDPSNPQIAGGADVLAALDGTK